MEAGREPAGAAAATSRPGEGEARLRRAHAGLQKAAGLRARPAAVSESAAIFDKDPTQVAREALADCERGLQLLPGCADAWFLKGELLSALERYREAAQAYGEGLKRVQGGVVPADLALKLAHLQEMNFRGSACQGELSRGGSPTASPPAPSDGGELGAGLDLAPPGGAPAGGAPGVATPPGGAAGGLGGAGGGAHGGGYVSRRSERRLGASVGEEFECSLCLRLLYEPVTTGCGHTFCKPCLGRVADHSSRCPYCRTVLYYFAGEMATNQTLNNILLKHFPEECRARAAEESTAPQTAPGSTPGQRRVLPLFVMTSVFPGQRQALNIFEPRYRLLVRRVMMGSRRLGMIPHGGSDGVPLRLGTEVEIVECEAQPDGRFHIEVVGLQRFMVEEDWEQDGYRVASVSCVEDEPPEDTNVTAALVQGTERLVQEIVDNLSREGVLRSGQASDYLYMAGKKPAPTEAEKFSFWAASLAPLQLNEVKACLRTRVTGTRLQIVIGSLKKGLNPAAGGCAVF